MRIAILTFGGHAYYPHLFIRSVLTGKHEFRVFAPDNQKAEFGKIIKDCSHFHFFRKPRMRDPSNIFLLRHLIRSLREFQPDVIHLMSYYPWLVFISRELARYRMVITVHDPHKHVGDIASKIVPGSEKYFYQQADQIITLGYRMQDELIGRQGVRADKITVIKHGNLSIYTLWAPPAIEEVSNTVLFFGRIYAYKGVEYLMQAAPVISRSIPDVRFIIAGTGSNRYLRKIRRMAGGNDRFYFLDEYLTDEKAARLFRESSLLVLPYIDASQSGVLLMGYAFKKPVITTTVGSLPEYVEDGITGYVIPPCAPEALAEKVIYLLQNPALRLKMGIAGYQKSLNDFSWENIAKQALQVYHKAFSG